MPDIRILTRNCFFSKFLKHISHEIRTCDADIICLQEIRGEDTIRRLAIPEEYETRHSKSNSSFVKVRRIIDFNNAFISRLKILDYGEDHPVIEKKGRNIFAGTSQWATFECGKRPVRVYNCHFDCRNLGVTFRQDMLKKILKHAEDFDGPTVISGDFNTVMPKPSLYRRIVRIWHSLPPTDIQKSESEAFRDLAEEHGFKEISRMENTWLFFGLYLIGYKALDLKTDWILVRGFKRTSYQIGQGVGDHKSILGILEF